MTAARLLRSLELFVLGHEYGHVITSHTDDLGPNPSKDPSIRRNWDTEYGSDRVGLGLLYGVMGDLTLTFWGAVQFFVCMEVFDRCRSILTKGSFDPKATSPIHPPHLARVSSCRTVLREDRPAAETETAIQLANSAQTRSGVDYGRWPSRSGSRCTSRACVRQSSGRSAALAQQPGQSMPNQRFGDRGRLELRLVPYQRRRWNDLLGKKHDSHSGRQPLFQYLETSAFHRRGHCRP